MDREFEVGDRVRYVVRNQADYPADNYTDLEGQEGVVLDNRCYKARDEWIHVDWPNQRFRGHGRHSFSTCMGTCWNVSIYSLNLLQKEPNPVKIKFLEKLFGKPLKELKKLCILDKEGGVIRKDVILELGWEKGSKQILETTLTKKK